MRRICDKMTRSFGCKRGILDNVLHIFRTCERSFRIRDPCRVVTRFRKLKRLFRNLAGDIKHALTFGGKLLTDLQFVNLTLLGKLGSTDSISSQSFGFQARLL